MDGRAGRRVASHAGRALAHHQDAEPADADAVALLEVLGHQADQVAEHRLGLLFRHLVGFREIRGEMLQGHGRLCARFLRCHGWPSSLESGLQSHSSHARIRRFGWGLTMTYCGKMWVFSTRGVRKWPTTGLAAMPHPAEATDLAVDIGFFRSGSAPRLDLGRVGI